MIAKVGLTLAALGAQYVLMHSHKAGYAHWIWIAPVSAILFLIGSRWVAVQAPQARSRWSLPLVVFALLSLFVPPAMYVAREWMQVPTNVSNILVRDGVFYVASVTIVSGGWLFAVLLLWLRYRATARPSPKGLE